ncbi:hypothetical protein CIB48_g5893 [Xylaria polymorpha]|nr:hypothetical protein CIB48_g5893 [Xylaria polymorpha]
MPAYYYDRQQKDGYELAHYLGRDLRQSHRPTKFIINEGTLVMDERIFEDRHHTSSGSNNKSNTVIYNAPGSTCTWSAARTSPNTPSVAAASAAAGVATMGTAPSASPCA